MIAVVVIAVIALVLAAYAFAPLLRGARRIEPPDDAAAADASERRRAALGAIVELESDHLMGKISVQDLETLRREYEAEALEALRALDALGRDPDDRLEQEIGTIRAKLQCPACGALRPLSEPCPRCGSTTESA